MDSYILPILHAEIGIGNHLLEAFLQWVDFRVEQIPFEEYVARVEWYEAMHDNEFKTHEWDSWVEQKGTKLADLHME